MGKLKLSKRDVKAVKDTIKHWTRDVRAKLKKGIKIKEVGSLRLVWADNLKKVKCFSGSCPLCQIYYNDVGDPPCASCPYYKKYGDACTRSGFKNTFIGHWRIFRQNPCLETCNGMIEALEEILK